MQQSLDDIYCFGRLPNDTEKFWELNIELTYLDPFSQLQKEKGSSLIMCAIWMLCDPKSSLVNSSLKDHEIKANLANNFLKNPKFDWAKYGPYIRAYQHYCKTPIEKSLDQLKVILDERQATIDGLDWDTDFEKKDKIYLSQESYYEKYFAIRDKLNNEREEALAYGRYTPSSLEARGQSI